MTIGKNHRNCFGGSGKDDVIRREASRYAMITGTAQVGKSRNFRGVLRVSIFSFCMSQNMRGRKRMSAGPAIVRLRLTALCFTMIHRAHHKRLVFCVPRYRQAGA